MPFNNPPGYSKGAEVAFWQSQRETDNAQMGIMVLGIAPPFKSWEKKCTFSLELFSLSC